MDRVRTGLAGRTHHHPHQLHAAGHPDDQQSHRAGHGPWQGDGARRVRRCAFQAGAGGARAVDRPLRDLVHGAHGSARPRRERRLLVPEPAPAPDRGGRDRAGSARAITTRSRTSRPTLRSPHRPWPPKTGPGSLLTQYRFKADQFGQLVPRTGQGLDRDRRRDAASGGLPAQEPGHVPRHPGRRPDVQGGRADDDRLAGRTQPGGAARASGATSPGACTPPWPGWDPSIFSAKRVWPLDPLTTAIRRDDAPIEFHYRPLATFGKHTHAARDFSRGPPDRHRNELAALRSERRRRLWYGHRHPVQLAIPAAP